MLGDSPCSGGPRAPESSASIERNSPIRSSDCFLPSGRGVSPSAVACCGAEVIRATLLDDSP